MKISKLSDVANVWQALQMLSWYSQCSWMALKRSFLSLCAYLYVGCALACCMSGDWRLEDNQVSSLTLFEAGSL